MANSEETAFFDAGLRHYSAALKAVAEFREMVYARVREAILRQPEVSSVSVAADASLSSTGGGVNQAHFLGVFAPTARLRADKLGPGEGDTARLELGLWWNGPGASSGVVAYAGVANTPWARALTKPAGFAGSLWRSGSSMYLLLPLTSEGELDETLDELLQALDRACREKISPAE